MFIREEQQQENIEVVEEFNELKAAGAGVELQYWNEDKGEWRDCAFQIACDRNTKDILYRIVTVDDDDEATIKFLHGELVKLRSKDNAWCELNIELQGRLDKERNVNVRMKEQHASDINAYVKRESELIGELDKLHAIKDELHSAYRDTIAELQKEVRALTKDKQVFKGKVIRAALDIADALERFQ